mgnify:CR=1 FL=1
MYNFFLAILYLTEYSPETMVTRIRVQLERLCPVRVRYNGL